VIKNAIAYITRKRNRTLIIFIILTIVFSCLYSCLTIMKSSNEIEKALYESSNSSISITKKDGEYFNVNQFKDIEKLKEVEEIIIQYDGLAKLKDAKVVSGEQIINREDLSDEFKNVVSFEATNNTKRNILFSSRVFTIKEGKNIEENDKNSIIVHEEFAKKNNLKLGDEVNLELLDIEKSGRIKSHKFKIIGIFSGKKQETYTGLSSDFSENMMFVDYSTSQEILNKSENNKIANKILMYSGSAESTDLALNKLKELKIDESKYFVEKDSNAFEESLESVSGIKHMIKIMTYSIMLGGMVILSLILILWLRERIYEIGIFLSIGTSKIQIIMQFIFELLFISIPSIIASLFLGNVLLRVIAGGFINSDNSMISGGNLINNSSFILNITTLGQSYLILISIIVLSVVFASSLILIKGYKKKSKAYATRSKKSDDGNRHRHKIAAGIKITTGTEQSGA
jgi:putative ABC transport system permease protein